MTWFDKHSPSSLKDIKGQVTNKLLKHAQQNPKGKALMIHGPAGTGKTSSVYALAREQDYELVELNASSIMNKDKVKQIVTNASLTKSLFGQRIILIDDIDSISGRKDRGGITELIKCIKETRTPIFITVIDPWDSKIRTLRRYCKMVEFKKVRASIIKGVLRRICEIERVKADDSVIYRIAVHSNGDVRAAINNLEMLSGDGEITEFELEAMGYREKPVSIFNGLQTLFKANNFSEAIHSLDDVELDFDTKMLWVTENVTKEFRTGPEIAEAFNALSRADLFYGRIRKQQYWRFLVYVNALMTAGVNNARVNNSGFTKYSKPDKILKLWKSKSRRELRKQLAIKLQSSIKSSISKVVNDVLPYVKLLARNESFINHYEITNDELKSL